MFSPSWIPFWKRILNNVLILLDLFIPVTILTGNIFLWRNNFGLQKTAYCLPPPPTGDLIGTNQQPDHHVPSRKEPRVTFEFKLLMLPLSANSGSYLWSCDH